MDMKVAISYGWPELREHPMHRHSEWEILIYLEGNGVFHTELGEISFAPGRAVITPPGILHSSRSSQDFWSISVRGDFSRWIMTDAPLPLWDNEQGDGVSLVKILYRNRYTESPFLSELTEAYVHFWVERAQMEGESDAAVEQIRQEIEERALEREADIGKILRSSGYAEDYIRKLFREKYGVPPLKYLTRIRMEHACFLLEIYKGSLSMAEVAEKCGYEDYIYFSKTFKAHKGMSPREYAKIV